MVHWDSKHLLSLSVKQLIDRLPIHISYDDQEKPLGVPFQMFECLWKEDNNKKKSSKVKQDKTYFVV